MEDQEATHWEAATPSRWARARKAVSNWLQSWPLFGAILFWVVAGIAALTALTALWAPKDKTGWDRLFTVWSPGAAGSNAYEILKLALTLIGGVGAVSYLVIKFRERTAAEREEQRANRKEEREVAEIERAKRQYAEDVLRTEQRYQEELRQAKQRTIEDKLLAAVQQLGSESQQV